jgi:tripartite-type tricarboxylate transporter receptor subunit TctC
MRFIRKQMAAVLCATMVALVAGRAEAQWPQRPVTLVVPFGAGGNVDTFARIVASHLNVALGQPVIVENCVGASGNIALASVARAPADGYTLVVGSVGTHGAGPFLFSKLSFDAARDFQPVAS